TEPIRGPVALANLPTVKVALLLPLSGESLALGNAMLDAGTLALYDKYLATPQDQIRANVVLIPKDTGNSPDVAAQVAAQVMNQGANFIVGPLFSNAVPGVAKVAKGGNVNLVTLSNNQAVAGDNTYIFGFLPEQQVERIAEYAILQKIDTFG